MKKPVGIILVSILNLIIGVFALTIGFIYAMTRSVHPIFVFIFSIIGVVYIALAVGLFMLKNWAKVLSIIFFSIAILENIFSQFFIAKPTSLNNIEMFSSWFRLILSSVVVFYLLRKRI